MHRGKAYHTFMLASAKDRDVRRKFLALAKRFAPDGGSILDFGAGTGIDAKILATQGFRVFAYEPCPENRAHLETYCREEIANGKVAVNDLPNDCALPLITANFAVLNLISDKKELFARFARLLAPNGHVIANLLNPFFLGDARYPWWRKNLSTLARKGSYVIEGEDGPLYRFTPSVLASAARGFRLVAIHPRASGLALSRYIFVVLKKI